MFLLFHPFFYYFYPFQVSVALQAGRIYEVIDDRMGSYPFECVVKFFTLALKCCEEETDARTSMAEVTRELEGIWLMMLDSDIRTTDPMVSFSSFNKVSVTYQKKKKKILWFLMLKR